MDVLNISLVNFQNFFLVFVRILSIFIIAPFFGSRNIPALGKIGFSLLFSLIVYPLVKFQNVPLEVIPFFNNVLREIVTGLIIGYVALLIFIAVQLGGHIIDIQMGYGIMNIIDPQSGAQISLVGQFFYLMAILIFLTVNGHHIIISGVVKSFDIIPLQGFAFTNLIMKNLDRFTSNIFLIALKVAAPALAVLFLAEIAQGFVARTVPQINVFLVGFPIRIGLGLFVLAFSMPLFVYFFKILINQLYKDIMVITRSV